MQQMDYDASNNKKTDFLKHLAQDSNHRLSKTLDVRQQSPIL
jgi:hypothetical protein